MTQKIERSPLGDLLVEMGLVDREQLAIALSHQRSQGGRLGRILADRKLVDEDRLAKAIAARLGLEAVNLSSLKIHERVLALIPAGVALKYGALPIAIKRTNQAEFVYVVMADPLDTEALGELARVSGREIRVLVATATDLDRALEQHYRPTAVRPPAADALAAQKAIAQPIVGQPATPPKNDPSKRGLPAPSPTGPLPAQPQARARSAQGAAQPAAAPSTLPPRMELPRATTAQIPTAPSQSGTKPLPQTTGTKTLPPLPARTVPPTAPPRPEPSRSSQNPLVGSQPPVPSASGQSQARAVMPPPPSPSRAKDPTPLPPIHRPTPSSGSPMLPPVRVPLSAPRVPTADEDRTSHESNSLSDAFKMSALAGGDVESTLGEWDRAVRDWPRPSTPSISTTQTINQDGPHGAAAMRSSLGEPAATQSVSQESALGTLVIEPVTTESSLKDLGVSLEEVPLAVASDVPTSIPQANVIEEVQVEILEIAEGVDDIKTSQVELTEDYELMILRSSLPEAIKPNEGTAKRRDRDHSMSALEIPVDISDAPSPFEGPENVDIPVGLERTGIIPAIDWENEEFVPPPLSKQPVQPLLAGSDDIPTSSAVVRARSEPFEPAEETPIASDEITVDPLHKAEPRFDTLLEARAAAQEDEAPRKRRSDPPMMAMSSPPPPPPPTPAPTLEIVREVVSDRHLDDNDELTRDENPLELAPSDDSDSSDMPVIEPSSLVSLMDDDGTSKVQDTGADQAPVLHLVEPVPEQPEPPLPPPTLLFDEHDRQASPVKSARAPKEPGEEETNPRIDGKLVRAALASATIADEPSPLEKIEDPTPPRDTVDRDRVLDDLEGMFIAAPKAETPRPVPSASGPDDTTRLVEALLANDSLNSAERAQLVLALGRLLVSKGIITADELALELRKT